MCLFYPQSLPHVEETVTLPDSADASDQAFGSDVVSDKDYWVNLNQGTNCSRWVPPYGASCERSESAAGKADSGRTDSVLFFSVSFAFLFFLRKNVASIDLQWPPAFATCATNTSAVGQTGRRAVLTPVLCPTCAFVLQLINAALTRSEFWEGLKKKTVWLHLRAHFFLNN